MADQERRLSTVRLVEVGEGLPVRIDKLARRLNRLQTEWLFQVGGSVTSEALGNPDVGDHSYNAQNLHSQLRQFAQPGELVVGITHVRVAAKPSGARRFESDYFSIGDFSQVSVITLHRSVAEYRGPTVTLEQYLGHLLVGEILMLSAGVNLSHTASKHCVFDECQDRTTLRDCIDRAWICEDCVAKLKQRNVGTRVIEAAGGVLRWSKRNHLSFVLRFTLSHPITSLCVGTAFGWYISAVIQPDRAVEVGLAAALSVLGVAVYARWFMK